MTSRQTVVTEEQFAAYPKQPARRKIWTAFEA